MLQLTSSQTSRRSFLLDLFLVAVLREDERMNQLSNFDRVLEVKAVSRILEHHDVIVSQIREATPVERSIVDNLSLERLRAVQHQTATVECLIKLWKAVDVLLVLVNRIKIDLQGSVGVQIEKKRSLENLIFDFRLNLFDRVFQRHVFKASECDCLLDHALAGLVQMRVRAAVDRRSVETDKAVDHVREHA